MLEHYPEVKVNEPRIYACESWEHFITLVRKDWPLRESQDRFLTADLVLFRGHANQTWKLMSKLDRNLQTKVTDESGKEMHLSWRANAGVSAYATYCAAILNEFRRLVHGMPGSRADERDSFDAVSGSRRGRKAGEHRLA